MLGNPETYLPIDSIGDARDSAYILSINMNICDHVNERTIQVINNINYWDSYLDNPEELE